MLQKTLLVTTMLASTLRTTLAFAPRGRSFGLPLSSRGYSSTSMAMANPKVYFDMEVGGEELGRVTM